MGAIAVAMALGGCSRMHGEVELEVSRSEVVETARADLPALAGALDAEIEESWGTWSAGGAKNNFQVSYRATARLVDTSATSNDIAEALDALGYDVIQDNEAAVVGMRDGLKIISSPGDAPFRVSVVGPYLRTETGTVSTGPREDLDLPTDEDSPGST
ncbi:hypothetical protein [Actinotalea sp. C106]|uniref:hypothetical protein n=1 Tax=Actinotalea sp. C106 TaxID=2908644 RepID=UPI00202919BD|nr:hypothetical protein [Actinotalea sp. C106]